MSTFNLSHKDMTNKNEEIVLIVVNETERLALVVTESDKD